MPFKRPAEEEVLKAIGLGRKGRSAAFYDLHPQLAKKCSVDWHHFIPDESLYQKIDLPSPDDWLTSHPEVGQSFENFYSSPRNKLEKPRNVIYLQPCSFVTKTTIPSSILDAMVSYATLFFGVKITLAPPLHLTKNFATRKNPYTGNDQINAENILKNISRNLPKDAFCLAVVTLSDIYPNDSWNFVFGLASLSERCGVYSLARYLPSFPDPPDTTSPAFDSSGLLRLAKNVMCHEVGHMFGIRHCIYFNCLMNGSNHRGESEKRPSYLCPVCLRKLQAACKFNVVERYKNLLQFAADHGLTDEAAWYQLWLEKNASI